MRKHSCLLDPITLLQIYFFGVLVSLPSWRPPTSGGFNGFGPLACFILVINAATGFSVSFVLKYTDNLVKGFSTSAAVLLATIVSTMCCSFQITQAFTVGVLIVSSSFYLYFGHQNKMLLDCAADSGINAIATAVKNNPTGEEVSELLGSTPKHRRTGSET